MVETARKSIPKCKQMYHPLWYYIIDHTGQHTPTNSLLKDYLQDMQSEIRTKIVMETQELDEDEARFLCRIIESDNYDTVCPTDNKERIIKECFISILKYIRRNASRGMSETEYTSRTLMPLLDATVETNPDLVISYGEWCLASSAYRRNQTRDPQLRARMDYRTDIRINFSGLFGGAEVAVGEVSGGVPKCSAAKEWRDKMKVSWELRDIWFYISSKFQGVDTSAVVFWGLQDIGFELKFYALVPYKRLFHLVLINTVRKPSSKYDLHNLQSVLNALLTFKKNVEGTIAHLVKLEKSQIRRESNHIEWQCKYPIIYTPTQAKTKRVH
ncbi:9098_t:CDS:2 [Paraglomus brasilianum]|uniref:9098_t:CDS:1 n=1 Tax=Paraglomus brasilianum TaxID=144538 RepID=A0A9N8VYK2_9GLOM|nr:9098_t:CDS:2 [Paraglomus brasilianum]